MNNARVLGNNITLLLNRKSVSKEAFANSLGYSCFDVEKLCDARLLTTKEDIEDIARYFDVSVDELLEYKGEDAYSGKGFIHCMGQFKLQENKDKILDIFDMYCDLREMLEE